MTQVGLFWDILLGPFLLYVFSDFLISNLHVLSAILTPESRRGQLGFILSLFMKSFLLSDAVRLCKFTTFRELFDWYCP